jgi:hypothetical protein
MLEPGGPTSSRGTGAGSRTSGATGHTPSLSRPQCRPGYTRQAVCSAPLASSTQLQPVRSALCSCLALSRSRRSHASRDASCRSVTAPALSAPVAEARPAAGTRTARPASAEPAQATAAGGKARPGRKVQGPAVSANRKRGCRPWRLAANASIHTHACSKKLSRSHDGTPPSWFHARRAFPRGRVAARGHAAAPLRRPHRDARPLFLGARLWLDTSRQEHTQGCSWAGPVPPAVGEHPRNQGRPQRVVAAAAAAHRDSARDSQGFGPGVVAWPWGPRGCRPADSRQRRSFGCAFLGEPGCGSCVRCGCRA